MIGAFSVPQQGERIDLVPFGKQGQLLQKILLYEQVKILGGLVKVQIMDLAAVHHVKAAGENSIGHVIDSLMDYGFANYGVYSQESRVLESIPVLGGTKRYVSVKSAPFSAVIQKNGTTVECIYEIPEYLSAPVKEGDAVGKIYYEFAGERIGESDITVCESVQKIKQVQIFYRMLINFIMGPR